MKQIRVLFLDFDGVLNSSAYFVRRTSRLDGLSIEAFALTQLDPDAIERVNRIVEATGCVIVASTAWRTTFKTPRSALRGLLVVRGFSGVLLDVTPIFGNGMRDRCMEIAAWMRDAHARGFDITSYAIVDDNPEAGIGNAARFVRTDFAVGLDEAGEKRLIEILLQPLGV